MVLWWLDWLHWFDGESHTLGEAYRFVGYVLLGKKGGWLHPIRDHGHLPNSVIHMAAALSRILEESFMLKVDFLSFYESMVLYRNKSKHPDGACSTGIGPVFSSTST